MGRHAVQQTAEGGAAERRDTGGSALSVSLRCRDRIVDLTHPVVMGIVNVTPDSFSDGGRFLDTDAAVRHGMRLAEEGAALIDVGGESTRPGAAPVGIEEELRRVIPVVERLRSATTAVISVDTSKPEVMRAAAAAGAGLVNDVRALREAGALEAALESGCAVCLMHMQGEPRTMQLAPAYGDVVGEVGAFLAERVRACRAAGLSAEQLVIDPGFGFGKTLDHNLTLLRGLRALAPAGPPVMVGLSRKSMVGKLGGGRPGGHPEGERMLGSVVLAVLAVLAGARIVRAHDVAATLEALRMVEAVSES